MEDWREREELELLRGVRPAVEQLWYRGEYRPELMKECVAVVGSRRMTEYGRRVLEKLIPQLVFEGKTIVSGFMYGVDQYAHKLTMDNGGKTVAVLGWGIRERLAASDLRLAEGILKSGGILLSEWESQPALLWTFPYRNRIVAGLATDIYVIEGGRKSGSLITAGWANKLSRRLWAVPGPITSKVSEGTNYLIATGKAKAWLGSESRVVNSELRKNSKDPLINLLVNEEMTADEVARKLKRPVAEVGAQLSLLTLAGELKERKGKYYK